MRDPKTAAPDSGSHQVHQLTWDLNPAKTTLNPLIGGNITMHNSAKILIIAFVTLALMHRRV
jgi:hypothetical protein